MRCGKRKKNKIVFQGRFYCRGLDRNGKVLWEETATNLVTDVALTAALSTLLGGGSQITTWYMGLINNSPTPSIVAGDTISSHAGWAEATAYTGNRKTVAFSAAAAKVIATSAACSFSINGTVALYGAFIVSNNTVGGTTGQLFSAAQFDSANVQNMVNGQTFETNYQLSAASA